MKIIGLDNGRAEQYRVIWFLLNFAAVILDRLLVNPLAAHPIVFIGRYIGFLRDRLNRGAHRN